LIIVFINLRQNLYLFHGRINRKLLNNNPIVDADAAIILKANPNAMQNSKYKYLRGGRIMNESRELKKMYLIYPLVQINPLIHFISTEPIPKKEKLIIILMEKRRS